MERTVSAEELRVFKAGGEMPNVNALYSSFKAARTANNALTDEIAELRANLERLQTSASQPNLVHNIPTTPPVPPVRPSSAQPAAARPSSAGAQHEGRLLSGRGEGRGSEERRKFVHILTDRPLHAR